MKPIITIHGLISSFFSIVLFCCTLSADSFYTLQLTAIIMPCDDAIFSAGVCAAALKPCRRALKLHVDSFSCLSLQRCQSRCGVPHRRLLEHRRGELHQSRALCLRYDRCLRCHWALRNAGLYWKHWYESSGVRWHHTTIVLFICTITTSWQKL